MKLTTALVLAIVVAFAAAGSVSYVKRSDFNSQSLPASHEEHHEPHHYPAYKFEYGVHDPHTGDHKSQWEHRDGDVVKGEYTLDEADGTVRKVSYRADAKSGFHAHVQRLGHATHAAADSQAEGFGFGTGFGF